jgi:Ca-activated chloride channel family protein
MRTTITIGIIVAALSTAAVAHGAVYAESAVAVLPFVNTSGTDELDYLETAVAKMVTTDLKQSKHLTVVTRDNLDDVLAELKLEKSELTDPINAQKVGKLLNADLIVTGSVLGISGELRFDAHAIDVETAEVVAAEQIVGEGENEVMAMVDDLSTRLIFDLTGETVVINNTGPVLGPIDPVFEGAALSFWPILGNDYGLVGETSRAYLEVKFVAGESTKVQKIDRLPLNLCLVIDRSGSMNEAGKIDYVKDAAKYVIDNLGPQDIISIVAYETGVTVIQKPTRVENKTELKSKVDEIYTGDMTNLSGGLEEGYELVRKKAKKKYVNRVILLSDGLANEGITDREVLASIVREELKKKAIYTTTMGVGADYDDKMLTMLATSGAGNYYYIARPDEIPSIFAREISGMVNLVATSIGLELELEPGVSIAKVHGYPYDDLGDNKYSIAVGDMATKEERTIFVELNLPNVAEETLLQLGRVAMKYDDAIADKKDLYAETTLAMHFIKNEEVVAANEVTEVMNTGYLMENAMVMEQAQELIEEGKRDEATELVKKQKDKTVERAVGGRSQALLDNADDLDELAATLEAPAAEVSDEEAEKAAGAGAVKTSYH